ncbi:MAG: class I SAM-dependent methyltransferase, partial [Bacteroidia bacterium]
IVILEFSYPTNPVLKAGYNFYFSYLTPLIGKIFSKDPRAYSYLMESVKAFPNNQDFVAIMNGSGFKNSGFKGLSMGVAAIYHGYK